MSAAIEALREALAAGPTPTPWNSQERLSASENHRGYSIISPGGWYVAIVQPIDTDGITGGLNAAYIAAACNAAPELLAEVDRLTAERDGLRADASGTAKLAAFGAWCAQEFRRELADVDGGSAQDAMERLGLLKRIEVTQPCGEGCVCAEVGFPADCYVFADDVKTALKDHP
jgi:hypothetical protein